MINITISAEQSTARTVSGFYRVMFLAQATTQSRDTLVTTLQECIDAGWLENSEAFEFCRVAFAQEPRMNEVVIRSIYDGESIKTVMESKPFDCLYIALEDFSDAYKSQLATYCKFSSYIYVTSSSVDTTSLFTDNPNVIYIHKAKHDFTFIQDDSGFQFDFAVDSETTSTEQYPEAAWISRFGCQRPASITWLNKPLIGVVPAPDAGHPLSNYYRPMYDTLVVQGSGKTMSGEWIDNLVFTKWLEFTLRSQVFSLLCENDKIPFNTVGKQLLINRVRYVLSVGVKLGGIADNYEVFVIEEQRTNRNIRIGFKAQLLGVINSVEDIQGTITA